MLMYSCGVKVILKTNNVFLVLVAGFLAAHVCRGQGPPCTGEEYLGEATPSNAATTAGTNSGTSYVMLDASMKVPCCGVVKEWKFAAKNSGQLTAQVWRNTAGSNYQVVGENVYAGITADTDPVQTVATTDTISTRQGDIIGWQSDGADIVGYVATQSAVMGRLFASGKTADQGTTSWAGSPVLGEQWHFSALLGPGSVPSFTGSLPGAATISTNDGAGASVFLVAPTDDDAYDIPDLVVSVVSETDKFEMNGLTVQTLATLASGSYDVTLKVEDPCGNSATNVLTVTVTDEPPDITSLPISAVLLPEDTKIVTSLHDLVFTDEDPTVVACSMTSDPSPAPFLLAPATGTSDYRISYIPSKTYKLKYSAVPLYVFNVSCTDQTSTSVIREFQVSVQPNDPPVPTGPSVINVDASTTLNGTLVHTVMSTNTDGDDLYYTMDAGSCPFEMYPNGEIHATDDLCAYKTTPCTVTYNVTDGYNTVGPETLTIRLTNVNYAPNITTPNKNYPSATEVTVLEHTDEGNPNLVNTVINVYDLVGTDADGDTIEWVLNFDNNNAKKLFNYDSTTGAITTAQNLDYEFFSREGWLTTRVQVRAWDGCEYSDWRILNIVIDDVNEPPVFRSERGYAIETFETTSTVTLPCPMFDVWEEDLYDYRTYDIDCGTNTEFRVEANSGSGTCEIYMVQSAEYDLDVPNLEKDVFECPVVITDKGGLTATTTLTITVHEEDDNWPVLDSNTYVDCSSVNNLTDVFDNINIRASATDIDVKEEHRRLTFYTSSSDFGVKSTGQLYSMTDWSTQSVPTVRTFYLYVKDEAGHTDSAEVTVCIDAAPTTTTTTTQATTLASAYSNISSFLDDSANLAWFIPLLLLGLLALGLSIFMCYRLCASGACGKVFGGGGKCFGGSKKVGGMRARMVQRGGGARVMGVRRVPVQSFSRIPVTPQRPMQALPPPPPPPPPPSKKLPKPPKPPKEPKPPKPPKPPKEPKPPKPPKPPKEEKPPKQMTPPHPDYDMPQRNTNSLMNYPKRQLKEPENADGNRQWSLWSNKDYTNDKAGYG